MQALSFFRGLLDTFSGNIGGEIAQNADQNPKVP